MRKSISLALAFAMIVLRGMAQPAPAPSAAPPESSSTQPPAPPAASTPAPSAPTPTPAPPPTSEQPAATETAPAASVNSSDNSTNAPAPQVTKSTKDTLSVDFPNEDIRTILRNVADLFELNLVVPDTLQGKTSVKLHDVTWQQIFQVVLAPVGYTYIEDGNIIKVVSTESLQQEPTTTEVFILNYARAADISPSISPLIDSGAGGKIQTDTRANALIITERPSRLNKIRPVIADLDKATSQVMIESKFIEVNNDDAKDIGVDWSSLKNYKLSATKIERDYKGDAGVSQSNGTTGTNINAPYIISGVNAANSINTTLGGASTPYQIGGVGTVTAATTPGLPNTITGLGPASLDTATFARLITREDTAVFSAADFAIFLSALKTLSNTKLVSNPTVVTLNNVDAFINVGQEYPIPNYSYDQEKGSFEVSGFNYKDIGIILKVTPQVNARGFIKLTLQPEVSSISGTVNFGGAGAATIPIISTRKAITQVTLKDGNTLGIGGLLQTNTQKTQTKVPLLGDIPFLGRLFRHDSTDAAKQNLLIFITAKTVNPEGAEVGEVFDPRVTRDIGLQKDELPGYRDGSSPFVPPPPPPSDKDKNSSK